MLFASGCATPLSGPTQGQLWREETERVGSSYKQAVESNRVLDAIRSKIPLVGGPREITFEMLTNNTKPTEQERAAIMEFAKLWQPFHTRFREIDVQYNNPMARITEAERQAVNALLADLYNGSFTYSEYANTSRVT